MLKALLACAALFCLVFHAARAAFASTSGATLPSALVQSIKDNLPPELADEVEGDLIYLSTIKGGRSSLLNSQIFGGTSLDGSAYLSFFLERISGFKRDDCVACAGPTSSVMGIGGIYPKLSQIERISVMLHEARHTEAAHGGWTHVPCPPNFWAINGQALNPSGSDTYIQGTDACDDVALGAYGIQIVFLKNIAEYCENCTSETKTTADAAAGRLLERIVAPSAFAELKAD